MQSRSAMAAAAAAAAAVAVACGAPGGFVPALNAMPAVDHAMAMIGAPNASLSGLNPALLGPGALVYPTPMGVGYPMCMPPLVNAAGSMMMMLVSWSMKESEVYVRLMHKLYSHTTHTHSFSLCPAATTSGTARATAEACAYGAAGPGAAAADAGVLWPAGGQSGAVQLQPAVQD